MTSTSTRPPKILPKTRTATSSGLTSNPREREAHFSKRRKVATACEPCRDRKGRCDGERPTCTPCRQRATSKHPVACTYRRPAEDAVGVSKPAANTDHLMHRMLQLESQLELQAATAGHLRNEANWLPASDLTRNHRDQIASDVSGGVSRPHPSVLENPITNQSGSDNHDSGGATRQYQEDAHRKPRGEDSDHVAISAMGATSGGQGLQTERATAYYGQSSAVQFLKDVHFSLGGPDQASDRIQSHENITRKRKLITRVSEDDLRHIDIVLPSRRTADDLMSVYWAKSHSLYPFLDRRSVELAYSTLWTGRSVPSEEEGIDTGLGSADSHAQTRIFHCALNAIFALACQLADSEIPLLDKNTLANRFFVRAKELLHIHVLEFGSLAQVQTLLILGQYLQSTNSPTRCWNSVGLACRIGQGLGLHVKDDGLRRHEHETEMRRRVWHGCYIMDCMLSMTLGRPMMTYDSKLGAQLPRMVPTLDLTDEEKTAGRQISNHIVFYQETIKLYQLVGRIIASIYKTAPGVLEEPEAFDSAALEAIMSMDDELENFERSVPPLLHWNTGQRLRSELPESIRNSVQRQSNVIHARYYYTRLLLHRTSFFQVCRQLASDWRSLASVPSRQTSSRQRVALVSAVQCIESAITLTKGINNAIRANCAGAWWYTSYYAYTAGMVILIAISCVPLHLHCDFYSLDQAWTECRETLASLEKNSSTAGLGLQSLNALYLRLVGSTSGVVLQPASSPYATNETQTRHESIFTTHDGVDHRPNDTTALPEPTANQDQDLDESWIARTPFIDFLEGDMDITLSGLFDGAFPEFVERS